MAPSQEKINDKIMQKIDGLVTTVNNIENTLAALPGDLVEKFDNRYASKRTEVAVDRLAWIVIGFVVTAILVFIFKQQ